MALVDDAGSASGVWSILSECIQPLLSIRRRPETTLLRDILLAAVLGI